MYLGIDFGTSGCRACVIDAAGEIHAEAAISVAEPEHHNGKIEQPASLWLQSLKHLLEKLSCRIDLIKIKRLAIDGTSGSVLLCNSSGQPLTNALMYNDASSTEATRLLRLHNPDSRHLCMSASSALAKAMALCETQTDKEIKILSQADYLSNHLCNRWGHSDYHNALKLGYDVVNLEWPQWVKDELPAHALPQVLSPGQEIGLIDPLRAAEYGFTSGVTVCSGSTDSNASFIATASTRPGDAVTSLGSTLVVKILAMHPIEELASGIYSHKMGDLWLSGGASNAGGKILKHYFSPIELKHYSGKIDIDKPTGLDYYPLTDAGERFPHNDPHKQPRLTPRPESEVQFLQGILEGLSAIEKSGYEKLCALGAQKPRRIKSTGGGAQNAAWTAMRNRVLGVKVLSARHTEASYGAALLALQGLKDYQQPNIDSPHPANRPNLD